QQPGRVMPVRQRKLIALQTDGQDWWKTKPKYSPKVLIGNWLEERERLIKDVETPGRSIYRTDFIWFPDLQQVQTLKRTMMEKNEGLPTQHFFNHHEEPRSRNLVSEYDDNYNRHSYNPMLPPRCIWNGHKLAWVPKKSDFPILEPPTNYGLLEYLMEKWHEKEDGVMKSVYTISYEKPPISAFATRRPKQPAKIYDYSSNPGYLPPNIIRIMGSERVQNYLQAIEQLARDTEGRDASV
ncbi:Uncharacterized protein C1orf158, partial [Colius striatus]